MRLPIERIEQSGQEASFAFHLRGAVTALIAPQPGIEQVPEGISEHVEGVDDQREEKPRPERQPGRLLHEPAPFAAEHRSPTGRSPAYAPALHGLHHPPRIVNPSAWRRSHRLAANGP